MRASAVRVVSRDLEIPALRKTRTRQSSRHAAALLFQLVQPRPLIHAEQRKR